MKKKILLLARFPVGGIRTYFRYVYSASFFSDYEFLIVTPEEGLRDFFDEVFKGKQYRYIETPASNSELLKVTYALLRQERIDLVHSHGFTAGVIASLPCKLFRKTHLMTAHDVFLKDQFEGLKGKIKHKLIELTFRQLDSIHAVSQDGLQNIVQFFPRLDKNKIKVILHGVDVDRFYGAEPIALEGIERSSEVFLIGFLGRFMAQKGFRTLVNAIELLVKSEAISLRPIVVTFGWGGYIREDTQFIQDKGLSEYFRMLPFTDNVTRCTHCLDCRTLDDFQRGEK